MRVTLTAGTARVVTGLLEVLAELPSTPALVARGAYEHLARVEALLPSPHSRQLWDDDRPAASNVELDAETANAVVELLDLFDEMPSTPPAVAADARHQAEGIRAELARLNEDAITMFDPDGQLAPNGNAP